MSKKYRGTHICEKCNKSFDWIYQDIIRNKLGCSIIEIPDDTKLVSNFTKDDDGNYNVVVNCMHCDYENQFFYRDKL